MGPIDEAYLSWLRTRPCQAGYVKSACGLRIVAHHTTGRGMGGSKRDDRDAVSLCSLHHQQFHDSGQLYPFDADQTKADLKWAAHTQLKEYIEREQDGI